MTLLIFPHQPWNFMFGNETSRSFLAQNICWWRIPLCSSWIYRRIDHRAVPKGKKQIKLSQCVMILIIYLTYTSEQIISTREFLIVTMLKIILQKVVSKKLFDLPYFSFWSAVGEKIKSQQWSWKWKNKYNNNNQ